MSKVHKILIINLAFIGDVILSTPVARALRENYPDAQIDMLVVPLTQPIARGNPYIDNALVYDKRGKHKKITELWKLIRFLRSREYDLAVCANFASRGAILAWAAGIRLRAGYDAQQAGWFLTHAASPRRTGICHESENYLDVLKPLGITTNDTSLAFNINPADAASLHLKVPRDWRRPLALVCPIGSYPLKSWTAAGYARLLEHMAELADCYLIGGRGEESQLKDINRLAGDKAGILAGTLNLGELAAFIAESKLLVTVDTGPMHMACAVRVPVAAFFGPTDPRVWGPRGPRDVIFQNIIDCSPCWGRIPCADHRCLEELNEEEVIRMVINLLQ